MSLYPVSSLLQRSTASPSAVALGLGLAASSYFFWGNLGNQTFGAFKVAIDRSHREKVGLNTKSALEVWAWAYKRGAAHMGTSAAISSLATLVAAIKINSISSTNLPLTRNFLFGLTATLAFPLFWTIGLMLPVNNRLLAILDLMYKAPNTTKDTDFTLTQENEINTLLTRWQQLHYVRIVVGAVGWLGALSAFTLIV